MYFGQSWSASGKGLMLTTFKYWHLITQRSVKKKKSHCVFYNNVEVYKNYQPTFF